MHASPIEILAHEQTPLGLLVLRRRELLGDPGTFVTEITLDNEFLMSSLNTDSEEALAGLALEAHSGDELRVLVGGLGLGSTARAALASERVARVDVIELLPPVIDWLARGLVPLSEELNADGRLHVIQGDAYAHLLGEPTREYDLVLIDIDHSPDDRLGRASDRFYTEAGLAAAKRHLTPDGVLSVWSYEESASFTAAMRATFGTVRVEPITFENWLVETTETDWIFVGHDRG